MAFVLIYHLPKEEEIEDPYFHVSITGLLTFAPHNYFMGDVLHIIEYLATSLFSIWVFLGGSDGKESAYSAWDLGSIPGLGRSPGEGNGNLLQYSCLKNPMDLGGYHPWGLKESDTTEQLTHCSLPARSPYHPLSLENQKMYADFFQIIPLKKNIAPVWEWLA